MKFDAPSNSAAHQSLLKAAEAQGMNVEALRRLLWLINAHPELVAHGQVFENLDAVFRSVLCIPEHLAWAGSWGEDIPDWQRLCRWISTDKVSLAEMPGLAEFDRQPKHKHDNPHLRHGVARHGVVASLWSRHQATPEYPPGEDSPLSARQYFYLQTLTTLAYMECRHKLSTVDFYSTYEGDGEAPIAPSPTAALGLAIREFSHIKYGPLLAQFPVANTPVDFVKLLSETHFNLDALLSTEPDADPDALVLDAARYLDAVQRFFRRFLMVTEDWKPPQNRRKRQGGGGGHGWRSGFVHFKGCDRIHLKRPRSRCEDPDIPQDDLTSVWIRLGADGWEEMNTFGAEMEQLEDMEALFHLYQPGESPPNLHQQHLQNLAVLTHAQNIPFHLSRPTPHELRHLGRVLESAINVYLRGNPSNIQTARSRARAALLIKSMLLLGVPIDQARRIRFEYINTNQMAEGDLPVMAAPVLLLYDASAEAQHYSGVAGFCMPAVQPHYKKNIPEELEEINRPEAAALLLPDHFGLGRQLKHFLEKGERPNDFIFGIDPDIARDAVKELLKESGQDRLSWDKLASALSGVLLDQGNDQTIAWMVTGDLTRAEEPRMHYTRHSVVTLQRAYGRAANRVARDLGMTACPNDLPDPLGSESAPGLGASLVITHQDLKSKLHVL
jgi:hypothetical protein